MQKQKRKRSLDTQQPTILYFKAPDLGDTGPDMRYGSGLGLRWTQVQVPGEKTRASGRAAWGQRLPLHRHKGLGRRERAKRKVLAVLALSWHRLAGGCDEEDCRRTCPQAEFNRYL